MDETQSMARIAQQYPVEFDPLEAIVQDFHSLGQALNVASADQRVLVLVAGPQHKTDLTREQLRPVIHSEEFVGRFHVDFESAEDWTTSIDGEHQSEGVFFIAAGEFGLKGTVLNELPLTATQADIRQALRQSNSLFVDSTDKKVYSSHVSKGRREGIHYQNNIPYGEDRDGDGEIDRHRARGSRGRGRPAGQR